MQYALDMHRDGSNPRWKGDDEELSMPFVIDAPSYWDALALALRSIQRARPHDCTLFWHDAARA